MNATLSAVLGLSVSLVAYPAHAQDHHHGSTPQAAAPYAGLERRTVKALSSEQIASLEAGRGMGLALAAELNGYPGPLHVLELADALQLSPDQRARTKALFEAMKAETIPIGRQVVAGEVALDRLFAEKRASRQPLDEQVARIAGAQGTLRAAHLRYHLAMMELLTPAQAVRYSELRGYAGGRSGGRGGGRLPPR